MAIRMAKMAIINGNKNGQHGNDKGARMAMIMAMLAIRMAIMAIVKNGNKNGQTWQMIMARMAMAIARIAMNNGNKIMASMATGMARMAIIRE